MDPRLNTSALHYAPLHIPETRAANTDSAESSPETPPNPTSNIVRALRGAAFGATLATVARAAGGVGVSGAALPGQLSAANLPPYGGKQLVDASIADFYLPMPEADTKPRNLSHFVHDNYIARENLKELGTDIMVHRGLADISNGVLENTLAAIRNAYDKGFRSIEIDVRVTKDGVAILLHDQTIGRMTDDPENRLVSQVEWSELQSKPLVVRNPADGNFIVTDQYIPTVEQALREMHRDMPGMSVVFDCKGTTAEAVFEILHKNPEMQQFVALKPYSKDYVGGFEHFLGNIYRRMQIDPVSAEDSGRRQEVLTSLRKTNLVPIFSQVMLDNEELLDLFPSADRATQKMPEGLAETALKWLQSWSGMGVKIIEAHSMGPTTVNGKAMGLLNTWLTDPQNGFSHAAMSGSYRYDDFSVEREDGKRDYYTWGDSGDRRAQTAESAIARATPGGLKEEAESLLTDVPNREIDALSSGEVYERGHPGLRLNLPQGAKIDLTQDLELANLRKEEYTQSQPKLDMEFLKKVRNGRANDAHPSQGAIDTTKLLGVLAAALVAGGMYHQRHSIRRHLVNLAGVVAQNMPGTLSNEYLSLRDRGGSSNTNTPQLDA